MQFFSARAWQTEKYRSILKRFRSQKIPKGFAMRLLLWLAAGNQPRMSRTIWRNRNTITLFFSLFDPAFGSARAITPSGAYPQIFCGTGCYSPLTKAYETGLGSAL